MFIKKVSNHKNVAAYLTYRLVKSHRVEGIPKHINILEPGSLPEIPTEKHNALADRIEHLISGDVVLFSDQDLRIEEGFRFYIGN